MRPEVSVIIPVHNGAKYVTKALESVLIQDVPLEVILVNDASTDETEEVLRPYLGRKEIHYILSERHLGAAQCRNLGVSRAQGRYIAYLDCDDWWEPGKLRKQIRLMKKTGCVLCSTGRRLVTASGKKTGRVIRVRQKITYKSLLLQNPINCSSVVLLRSVALRYPMSHDEYHEDYITWLRILKKYRTACAIDEPLLNYRVSSTGKSGGKIKSAYMTFMVYRYMGFSMPKSLACFMAYSVNGVMKYSTARLRSTVRRGK